jgi:hypothetical protein
LRGLPAAKKKVECDEKSDQDYDNDYDQGNVRTIHVCCKTLKCVKTLSFKAFVTCNFNNHMIIEKYVSR